MDGVADKRTPLLAAEVVPAQGAACDAEALSEPVRAPRTPTLTCTRIGAEAFPSSLSNASTATGFSMDSDVDLDCKLGLDDCGSKKPSRQVTSESVLPTPLGVASATSRKDDFMTAAMATFTMANMMINFGTLSIPSVFVHSGHVMGSLLIVLAGVACMFTGRLLGQVLERLADAGYSRPSYDDIVTVALGRRFAPVASLVCVVEVSACMFGNLIIIGQSINACIPSLGVENIIAISAGVAAVMSACPDNLYSYVHLLSAFFMSFACIAVLWSGWALPQWAYGLDAVHLNVDSLLTSSSLVLFAGAMHPMLVPIYHSCASQRDFDSAMRNGWLVFIVISIVFGSSAYFFFGDAAQVPIIQNIGKDLTLKPFAPTHDLVAISSICMVVKMQFSLVAIGRSLAETLARVMRVRIRDGNGGLNAFLLAIPCFAMAATGACFLDKQIALIESITGCLLMNLNAFIIPPFAYIRLCNPTGVRRGVAIFVLLAAIAFGLATSALELRKL
mmetsp:Transcript_72888/g.202212  ORF Transcript_72888/g.202212 Transcript_72888/m.202212 type:complete len:503 (-) Transcript_72888:149-1657(-)|eukprot:CAMPEP_0117503500 /NCGR_PEP_ID=MMETSP0784-20121206/24363_1 /TAXON_ID=39447 /ORGANISM="" /LENGTH=502 /DNA_ID=CAMNT_0005298821 /DNA_START=13 /DNA_END=1521 /DNA_ORIENTATION=+